MEETKIEGEKKTKNFYAVEILFHFSSSLNTLLYMIVTQAHTLANKILKKFSFLFNSFKTRTKKWKREREKNHDLKHIKI